jgi:hypothetical protein
MNPDLQLREIHDYASRQGWEIVETYQDTISGAKASRPGLKAGKVTVTDTIPTGLTLVSMAGTGWDSEGFELYISCTNLRFPQAII